MQQIILPVTAHLIPRPPLAHSQPDPAAAPPGPERGSQPCRGCGTCGGCGKCQMEKSQP